MQVGGFHKAVQESLVTWILDSVSGYGAAAVVYLVVSPHVE